MDSTQHEDHTPICETLEFHGPQFSEVPANHTQSVQSLSSLARTQPSLVASVLSDWINSRPVMPR